MEIVKILVGSAYLMLIYFLSSNYPPLHLLFFPTLGSFCFLFSLNTYVLKDMAKIILGATISSLLGCVLCYVFSGPLALFITALIVMAGLRYIKLHAPPIIAISLIPFFSHASLTWFTPLFTFLSLIALFAVLWIAERVSAIYHKKAVTKRAFMQYK